MKQHQFSLVQALIVAVGVLFFSGCNGEKIDSDLIDSITGKVSVDKITIDQEDFEMTEGESTVLTATVLPDDATDKTISWHSSKEEVVMISNTGKAMAMSPGKSVITAKAGSKTDFITITVIANAVPVTGVSLDKTNLELKVADSETLTATVTPDNATNKNVSWTSSDATIATVENGRVTGVKPGSVTITAKTEDGGKIAECALTVKTNLAPSVTVGAEHISAVSVVLKGEANLDAQMSSDMTMGIMWSENSGVLPSNSTKIEAKNIEAKEGSTTSYCYSVNLTGLDPAKTYYFRSYVTQNSQDTYGETMSFTTKELSSMLHTEDASNISAVSAILNATYDLTDVQYTNKTIGIYYGTSAETLSETFVAEPSSPKGSISENWTLLDPEQTYYCQSYIILDGKEYKESVKYFTTKKLSSMLETRGASDIAPTSAKMSAKLDLTDVQYTTKEYGFYWGTSEDSQTTYIKGGEIAENAYSASLSGLSPTSQYWYKSYLRMDGQTFFGEVKVLSTAVMPVTSVSLDKDVCTVHTIDSTFTLTPAVLPEEATSKAVRWESSNPSVAKVDENGRVTAKGNGSATITVTTEDQSKTATCEVTVAQWVTGITLNMTTLTLNEGQSATVSVASITPDNANDKSVTWSSSNTSVAKVDQNGKVTAFAGGDTATIIATANDGSRTSASCLVTVKSSTANCYIVSASGNYSFPTVKGNSSTSVGSVSDAEVLWESYGTATTPSVGSIINNISYSNNTIFFSTPSTLKNGNAVIAAKDASGNILWSWHIWVCEGYDPVATAQVYSNDAGTMMDRNLGATSVTPGNVGALGLLYQWGRKDPFLGSSQISYDYDSQERVKIASSTLSWPSPVSSDSGNGTIEYAVSNPTTFITYNSSNHEWYYTGSSSTDNTRWLSTKTIYDPCPPGWRVPDGGSNGVWAKALGSSSFPTWDSTNKGMNFSDKFGSAATIWYPAAGSLLPDVGDFFNVGVCGYWWSCTPYDYRVCDLFLSSGGGVRPSFIGTRAVGQSVRCQKEE
ncbi:MAG: Ig-like domain-containing protein [Bacteroidales bacterium]|nr:Ig-like domain-containing protein [Bacteroidales bacterium]